MFIVPCKVSVMAHNVALKRDRKRQLLIDMLEWLLLSVVSFSLWHSELWWSWLEKQLQES